METVNDLKPLFTTILLIVVGLISPSNGVDDRTYKTPIEMLAILFIVILSASFFYLLWNVAERTNKSNQ